MIKIIKVAIGIVVDKQKILITQRTGDVDQANLWEFPGGKINADETAYQALVREFKEEVDLDILAAEPLMIIEHDYPSYSVELSVFKITQFQGKAKSLQSQDLRWAAAEDLVNYHFPAANREIISKCTNTEDSIINL